MTCPAVSGGAVLVVAGRTPPGATVNDRWSVMFPPVIVVADGATVTAPRRIDTRGWSAAPRPVSPR